MDMRLLSVFVALLCWMQLCWGFHLLFFSRLEPFRVHPLKIIVYDEISKISIFYFRNGEMASEKSDWPLRARISVREATCLTNEVNLVEVRQIKLVTK